MGRSQETFNKKEIRNKKEKKRKEKAKKREIRKEEEKKNSLDDMIAYVDKEGNITSEPPEDDPEDIKAEDIEVSVPKKSEEDEIDPIRQGTITFFNDAKGYGFIKDSVTGESVFVHINNAVDDLKEGNLVSFEVEMGPKGPAANKVQIVK